MAEKPNEEANSQLSQLDEEDLQKLVADGRNTACASPICLRRTKPAQFSNVTISWLFAKFCYFPFENLEIKILFSFAMFCQSFKLMRQ